MAVPKRNLVYQENRSVCNYSRYRQSGKFNLVYQENRSVCNQPQLVRCFLPIQFTRKIGRSATSSERCRQWAEFSLLGKQVGLQLKKRLTLLSLNLVYQENRSVCNHNRLTTNLKGNLVYQENRSVCNLALLLGAGFPNLVYQENRSVCNSSGRCTAHLFNLVYQENRSVCN